MKKQLILLLFLTFTIKLLGQDYELFSTDTAYERSKIEPVVVIYNSYGKNGTNYQETKYLNSSGELLFSITREKCHFVELHGMVCKITRQKLTEEGKKHGYSKEKFSKPSRSKYKSELSWWKRRTRWRYEERNEYTNRVIYNLKDTALFWEVVDIDFNIKLERIENDYKRNKIVVESRFSTNGLISKTYRDYKTGKTLKTCVFNNQQIIVELIELVDFNKPKQDLSKMFIFYPNGEPYVVYSCISSNCETIIEWSKTGEIIERE